MLHSISWSQYFITITLSACAYYLIIIIKYFKWEVLQIFGITKLANSGNYYFSPDTKENEATEPVQNTDRALAMCINEIEAFSAQFESMDNNRSDFINAIKMITAKYQFEDMPESDKEITAVIMEKIEDHYPGAKDISPSDYSTIS